MSSVCPTQAEEQLEHMVNSEDPVLEEGMNLTHSRRWKNYTRMEVPRADVS